jgi:hypothetical protein
MMEHKNIFCWHGILHSFAPCFLVFLAHGSGESGIHAVAILDWVVKAVLLLIRIRVGSLALMRACFPLVVYVVVLYGPERG